MIGDKVIIIVDIHMNNHFGIIKIDVSMDEKIRKFIGVG